MIRFLLRLAPALIIQSVAHAQTPPLVPDVPSTLPTNEAIIAPQPSDNAARPPAEFQPPLPDGFGSLKDPEGVPDQTGSTTTKPSQPLSDPSDSEPVIIIMTSSLALGFMAGYGVRSVVSHHHRTQSRRRSR